MRIIREFWRRLAQAFAAAHYGTRADPWDLSGQASYDPRRYPPMPPLTPLERWGTCCPNDPRCDHSFLDYDDLATWLRKPLTDKEARDVIG